jgi:mRNA deadenylase 3'-5' endonuclease subunit Ccr4
MIQVVTYNILAQEYIGTHLERYAYIQDADILSRTFRRPKLLASALSYGKVDIVCLQEFDDPMYWNIAMACEGYSGFHSLRPRKSDGCAIFWDNSKYRSVGKWIVNLNDVIKQPVPIIQANPGKFKRDNVGIIVLLEDVSTHRLLCVGTVHLYWDCRMEDVKIHQARLMAMSIKQVIAEWTRGASRQIPWILAGDFNSTPTSDVYMYLTGKDDTGRADDEYKVSSSPLPEMKSAYETWKEPKFTNYTRDFKDCIDYVFYDSAHLAVRDLRLIDESKFSGVLAIPSREYSSDHLPLYAGFSYKEPPEPASVGKSKAPV